MEEKKQLVRLERNLERKGNPNTHTNEERPLTFVRLLIHPTRELIKEREKEEGEDWLETGPRKLSIMNCLKVLGATPAGRGRAGQGRAAAGMGNERHGGRRG